MCANLVSKNELIELGWRPNPNFWLPGFFFCGYCQEYHLFEAVTKIINNISHTIELCRQCGNGEDRFDYITFIGKES